MGADLTYLNTLTALIEGGTMQLSRNGGTLELLGFTSKWPMRSPVVQDPRRRLNYAFMLTEAAWILSGSNLLTDVCQVNPKMLAYSDDGFTLAGAYGPPVVDQLPYVVKTLSEDIDSRQAVLTTWRPRPAASKDIPCTVAMAFLIRRNLLQQHVFMRSSDAWLGLPYDVFSFSCIGLEVLRRLNQLSPKGCVFQPGQLQITAASLHLYDQNHEAARQLISSPRAALSTTGAVPEPWFTGDVSVQARLKEAVAQKAYWWRA